MDLVEYKRDIAMCQSRSDFYKCVSFQYPPISVYYNENQISHDIHNYLFATNLDPFLDNQNFRRAIKDYHTDVLKRYDKKIKKGCQLFH
jgi:hypothetical protein